MVIIALMALAAVTSLLFAVVYTVFFPWWRSILGRTLVVSKVSIAVLLVFNIMHLLNVDMGHTVYTYILVFALIGLVSATMSLMYKLYTSWKESK